VVLDVVIDTASVTIQIDKPFQPDLDAIIVQMEQFARSAGTDITVLDVRGLISRMIKGIAGCEHGCPANAKNLVSMGYKGFDVQYVEGGILTARIRTREGTDLCLKMFPDF
jgi:hypothetical protein